MTAAALTRLPLQATGYAVAYAGRTAMWVVARYMRNPLTHTAIAVLVATSALAASNAMFMQTHRHPSPWFVPEIADSGSPSPVVPATRPADLVAPKPAAALSVPKVTTPETTASIRATPPVAGEPVGNKEVFEIQTKLSLMKLFSGTIDGYYGPQTAAAIRRFEEAQGLKPTGELNRDIVGRILAAPDSLSQPKPQALEPAPTIASEPVAAAEAPLAQPQPMALTAPQAQPAVAPQTLAEIAAPAPLAAPQPLVAPTTTGSAGTQAMAATRNTFLGRPLPNDANEAVEMASQTANEAMDTIAGGVAALADLAAPDQTTPATANSATARLATTPKVGVPLRIEEEPTRPGEAVAVLDSNATPSEIAPAFSVSDPVVVAKVQRGLASLGFLHGPADGVAGEATAKAIRNFEVYYNYNVTGRITPELMDLLLANGAAI